MFNDSEMTKTILDNLINVGWAALIFICSYISNMAFSLYHNIKQLGQAFEYKRLIKANDRATLLNLMVGLNGYTLCSGIICEELNGDEYCAVKLDSNEKMTIGYIKRKDVVISPLGQKYLEEIGRYKDSVLD